MSDPVTTELSRCRVTMEPETMERVRALIKADDDLGAQKLILASVQLGKQTTA